MTQETRTELNDVLVVLQSIDRRLKKIEEIQRQNLEDKKAREERMTEIAEELDEQMRSMAAPLLPK